MRTEISFREDCVEKVVLVNSGWGGHKRGGGAWGTDSSFSCTYRKWYAQSRKINIQSSISFTSRYSRRSLQNSL